MKYKFNPLTWEFNLVPDSGTLKQKLNWLTGNFNLTKDASKYKQIYNVIEGEFNLRPATTQIVVHWVWSVQLTNAAKNWLLSLKAYGWTEQRNLPSEYTQLEYVYMTTGSYIKVEDLPISSGYKVEYDFQTTTLGSALRNYLGGRANWVSAGGGFRLSKLANSNNNRVVLYGFEAETEYYDPTTQFQANTRYKYTYNNGVCTLESGGSVISTRTFTVTDNTSTNWGINAYTNGSTWQTDTDGIYVYSLKVWNDQDELVMDLVPAKTSTEIGFYDKVTDTLRTASAGTFEAGGDTTPTPEQPIDIVSNNGVIKFSKNLANMVLPNVVEQYYIDNSWNILSSPVNFYYDTFIPVSPNTAYTLSGSKNFRYASLMEYDINQVFLKRTLIDSANTNAKTWTTRSDTAYIRFWSNPWSNETMTIDVVQSYNFQFERWSVPTPYHEYVEWWVYVEWITETIWVHGKNLFDENDVILGYFYNDSGTYTSNNVTYTSGKIPMNAGTTVTFSRGLAVAGVYLRIHAFDSNDNWIGLVAKSSTATDLSCTGTTPANTSYIRVCGAKKAAPSTEIDHECQVELGSTATEYAPYYNGDTATAEMLLKVSNYVDEQEILSWNITRKVGVQVFDGTENWKSAVTGKFYIDNYYMRNYNSMPTLCTHYEAVLASSTSQVGFGKIGLFATATQGQSSARLVIGDNNYTSVDDFKAYLSQQYQAGTPIIVLYPLIEQTTETVSGQPLDIPAWNSTIEITQASVDNLELEATYEQDV